MTIQANKLTCLLLGIGICGQALSGTMNDVSTKTVVVPIHQKEFYLGLEGLYVRSANDDLVFASQFDNLGTGGDLHHFHSITTKHHLAFRLEAGYNLANTGNDIQANWTHIKTDDSGSIANSNGSISSIRFSSGTTSAEINGQATFNLDEGNLQFVQKIQIDKVVTRLHGGLTAARIKHTLMSRDNDNSTDQLTGQSDSRFWGVGLRVGADSSYAISEQFDVILNVSGALLASKITSSTTVKEVDNTSADVSPNDDIHTIVPAGDVKLGLRWHVSDAYRGHYEIGAGVQAKGYFHVISHPAAMFPSGDFRDTELVSHYDVSNYGNCGLYLNFKWVTKVD